MIRRLAAMDVSVNTPTQKEKFSPLAMAAINGHLDSVKALLELGADPLADSARGDTPASMAAALGKST